MTTIKVHLSTIDGVSEHRSFKTLARARAFAVKCVGENAYNEGCSYAVCDYGVAKITVTGCTLRELFADKVEAAAGPYEVWSVIIDEDAGTSRPNVDGVFATLAEANAYADEISNSGADGVYLVGKTDEAAAAIEAQNAAYVAQLERDEVPF